MKGKLRVFVFLLTLLIVVNLLLQVLFFQHSFRRVFGLSVLGGWEELSDDAKNFLGDSSKYIGEMSSDLINRNGIIEAYIPEWRPVNGYKSAAYKVSLHRAHANEKQNRAFYSFIGSQEFAYIRASLNEATGERRIYLDGIREKEEDPYLGTVLHNLQREPTVQFFCGQLCKINEVTVIGVSDHSFEYQVYYNTNRGYFVRLYYIRGDGLEVLECTGEGFEELEREYDRNFRSNPTIIGDKYFPQSRDWARFLDFIDYEKSTPRAVWLTECAVRLAASAVLTAVTVTVGIVVIKKRGCKKAAPAEK